MLLRVLLMLLALFAAAAIGAQDADPDTAGAVGAYTVVPGDTLFAIARRFAVPLDDLQAQNGIQDPAALQVGMRLDIPPLDESRYLHHIVMPGDTLFAIARLYATTREELMSLNLVAEDESLPLGQPILAPIAPPIPLKPGFGYGIHIFIADKADDIAAQVLELGVNRVKIDAPWSRLEPARGEHDFDELDTLVKALAATGAQVLLNVHDAPDWSRQQYRATMNSALIDYGGPPDDLSELANFLTVMTARYKGLVDAYEVWKAPNLVKYWNAPVYDQPPQRDENGDYGLPGAISLGAAQYVGLLKVAHAAIKAQDASALVITAGLAPVGLDDKYNSIATDIYLAELLDAGAADYADGIGAVFSASAVPPALPCCAQPPGVESHYESFIQNYRALMAFYAAAMESRAVDLPLIATQVGWGTADGANLAVPATGFEWLNFTSQDEQALYVRQAFQLAQGMEKLDALYLYNLNGCAVNDEEACFFSLADADGARRPAYYTLAALRKTDSETS